MNDNLICYKEMSVWRSADIPAGFLSQHNTQEGTWGRLQVSAGSLKFYRLNEDGSTVSEHLLTPESGEWVIQPQQWHKIEPQGDDTQLQLSFWCDKTDYFRKKYGMTATHSAVKEALAHVAPCKTLDLGCGQGRNALTLALLGFDVDACDYNPGGLHGLAEAAAQENLPLQAFAYDINQADIGEDYGFIVATVVFMFLNPQRVPAIIADMQAHTQSGGYNLIVSAMDTADFPCLMPFNFTFKEGELARYYDGWEMVDYREEIGSMHATDANGKPIQLKFATMLARKP